MKESVAALHIVDLRDQAAGIGLLRYIDVSRNGIVVPKRRNPMHRRGVDFGIVPFSVHVWLDLALKVLLCTIRHTDIIIFGMHYQQKMNCVIKLFRLSEIDTTDLYSLEFLRYSMVIG